MRVAIVMPGYHTILEEFCHHLSLLDLDITLLIPDECPQNERKFTLRRYNALMVKSGYPVPITLFNELKEGKFDLIVTGEDFLITSWMSSLFSRLRDIPLVLIQEKYFVSGKNLLVPFHRIFLKTICKFVWAIASQIIAHSRASEYFMQEQGAPRKKITRIPIGVNTSKFSPIVDSSNEDVFSILSVARLIDHKGLPNLIEAVRILSYEGRDISLKIVGDGYLRDHLQEMISNKGLDGLVHIVHHIPYEKIPEVYRSADIFVLSSIVEIFGVSALEAMSTGLPIIVTNVGGLPDLVEHGYNGYLVEQENPESLARTLDKLLDRNEIDRMGKNAREKALKEFSWTKVASDHAEIFHAAMETCNVRNEKGGPS